MFRGAIGLLVLVLLSSVVGAGLSAGALTSGVVSPLTTADLPAGSTSTGPPQLQPALCAGLNLAQAGPVSAQAGPVTTVAFQTGQFDVSEAIMLTDNAGSTFQETVNQYAACRIVRPLPGLNVRGHGRMLPLAQVGDESRSFSFSLTVKGLQIDEDIVVFRTGRSCGVLEFVSPQGSLNSKSVEFIATIAASKMRSSNPAHSNLESASTFLNDACTATFVASAFRVQGHITPVTVDAYFGASGEVVTLRLTGDRTLTAIQNGPSTYVEGNKSFWRTFIQTRRSASRIAGHWIDVTSDQNGVAQFNDLNKGVILSLCDVGGSATYAGSATVNGVKVIKVHQDSMGGSETCYIEDDATPYVLRITAKDSNGSGDLVFSNYGVQPDIAAPRGAIPISQFIGTSGNTV